MYLLHLYASTVFIFVMRVNRPGVFLPHTLSEKKLRLNFSRLAINSPLTPTSKACWHQSKTRILES